MYLKKNSNKLFIDQFWDLSVPYLQRQNPGIAILRIFWNHYDQKHYKIKLQIQRNIYLCFIFLCLQREIIVMWWLNNTHGGPNLCSNETSFPFKHFIMSVRMEDLSRRFSLKYSFTDLNIQKKSIIYMKSEYITYKKKKPKTNVWNSFSKR